jgi:hypothetical protein
MIIAARGEMQRTKGKFLEPLVAEFAVTGRECAASAVKDAWVEHPWTEMVCAFYCSLPRSAFRPANRHEPDYKD